LMRLSAQHERTIIYREVVVPRGSDAASPQDLESEVE
jgi:hypothetical protein